MVRFKKGQILFPTLLIIPMLMLFIFLLFETTKLSREKIRQQFAVDSAAFIQMGDYTNLFNRTAYVNGAFPYRIFKELLTTDRRAPWTTETDSSAATSTDTRRSISYYDLLYESGAFPRRKDDYNGRWTEDDNEKLDDQGRWEIRFFEGESSNSSDLTVKHSGDGGHTDMYEARRGDRLNDYDKVNNELTFSGKRMLLTTGCDNKITPCKPTVTDYQARSLYVYWEYMYPQAIWYIRVYKLLGEIANSQIKVFEQLTDGFKFFRKSYYLNVGCENEGTCGEEGLKMGFMQTPFKPDRNIIQHFVKYIGVWAQNPRNVGACKKEYIMGMPRLDPCTFYWDESGKNTDGQPVQDEFDDVASGSGKGLFQLVTIGKDELKRIGKGFEVYQDWGEDIISNNFFDVNFAKENISNGCEGIQRGRPCVHAYVASQCPGLKDGRNNNCVWPDPTPKYQTRLYP